VAVPYAGIGRTIPAAEADLRAGAAGQWAYVPIGAYWPVRAETPSSNAAGLSGFVK
jgi:hypothetical protein